MNPLKVMVKVYWVILGIFFVIQTNFIMIYNDISAIYGDQRGTQPIIIWLVPSNIGCFQVPSGKLT